MGEHDMIIRMKRTAHAQVLNLSRGSSILTIWGRQYKIFWYYSHAAGDINTFTCNYCCGVRP